MQLRSNRMEGPGLCMCVCVCARVQNSHTLSKCTLPSTSVCSPTWKLSGTFLVPVLMSSSLVPLPARSCGFSWGAGQDGASSALVSSPIGQGFVSWRGCESRLEDVSSSPVPLKDEGDLLRKERKSFGEFLHHQANNGGLLLKPALAWRETSLFPGNDETLWRSQQASILLSIKKKKFCD